jgi:beta-N-acetylhexosaminidase
MKTFYLGLLLMFFSSIKSQEFTLDDFYSNNESLDQKVEEIFNYLDDTSKVGQMIVPATGRLGKSRKYVAELASKGWIGGILLLNGTVDVFTKDVNDFDSIMKVNGHLPLIYSADAEPTLVNRKIANSRKVPKTNQIHHLDSVKKVTTIISEDLNSIGINQNFAPVIDASPNKVVSNRSFGLNMDTVIEFSNEFVKVTQSHNIISTAKHFPGHGFVKGDTHKQLIYIDGEMKEVKNYIPLIDSGVLSIMVAHLAIKNNTKFNTDGLPSTCSKKIVTQLLKDSLGFKGLIITDAMNMGGVVNVENNGLMAAKAGCDQLLMPVNEKKVLFDILDEIKSDDEFKRNVYESVKKIIRIKICLGIVK